MSLALIIYRSLRQHLFSTLLTAGGLALASGLLLSVWMVRVGARESFVRSTSAFDAVLGARGSKLQLVLNALFHLEASPGNLAWADYQAIKRHPAVKTAIPIAVGDNLRGFRLVGTLPELFSVSYAPGKSFSIQAGGRIFDEAAKEAVVGSFAAHRLGLSVGDTFHPFHGLVFDPSQQHSDVYTVTGLLEPTGTPADRVVWIPLHGLQTMSGHDPRLATDVSAVLIQLRSPTAGFMLDLLYNRQGNRLTFAYPAGTLIADLFDRLGWFDRVLALVAYLVAFVAAASVLAAIYNSMDARKRDIAILRALGARRGLVFAAVVGEAAAIGLLGALAGFAVYGVIFSAVERILQAQTGVLLSLETFHPVLWIAPLGLVVLCAFGGLIPAVRAYRTSVAENLAPIS